MIAALGACGESACDAADDSIERAGCHTRVRLNKYPTGEAETARFLTRNHGEAPSHEVAIVLANWGMKNPKKFAALLSNLEPAERASIVKRISYAVVDGGDVRKFSSAMKPVAGEPVIREIISELGDYDLESDEAT